jgi:hypothetical protein
MKLSVKFVLAVGLISLVVSIFVAPVVRGFIKPITPSVGEGFDNGSGNYSWDGNTLNLNGNVVVNGTLRSRQMIVANNNQYQSGIMLEPSVAGDEGPYIRFYGQDSQPKMYLMAGRNNQKENEWGKY